MTPKEKAQKLVNKYTHQLYDAGHQISKPMVKQCALIAVEEIINSSPSLPILGESGHFGEDIELSTNFWNEVKTEINNL